VIARQIQSTSESKYSRFEIQNRNPTDLDFSWLCHIPSRLSQISCLQWVSSSHSTCPNYHLPITAHQNIASTTDTLSFNCWQLRSAAVNSISDSFNHGIEHSSCYTQNSRNQVSNQGHLPSVLWRCCLGGRKGIQPVKNTGRMVEVGTG